MKNFSMESPIIGNLRTLDSQKKALKRLNIETVKDLLYHFPTRYSHMSTISTINETIHDDLVTVYGIIKKPKIGKTYHSNIPTAEAQLEDINGDILNIKWFNQAFIAKTLQEGQSVKLTGKISDGKYGKTILNPEFEKIKSMPIDSHHSLFNTGENEETSFGYPIYRETRGIK